VTGAAVAILTLLAWLYTIRASVRMKFMDEQFAFSMWIVMMVAMMAPSAAPMLFAFSRMSRSAGGRTTGPTVAFLLGYIVLWIVFGVVAAVAQAVFECAGVVSTMGVSTSRFLNSALLFSTGIYQFLPFKNACLAKCRAPLGFLLTEWRDGRRGALIMGAHHGLYCVGCCWLLMALLFVAGTMNLVWIAALTLAVLLEKIIPIRGSLVSKFIGAVALGSGMLVLLR